MKRVDNFINGKFIEFDKEHLALITVCIIEFIEELQGEVHAIDLLYLTVMKEEAVSHEILIERLVGEVEGVARAGEHGALQEMGFVLVLLRYVVACVGEDIGQFVLVMVGEDFR